MSMTRKRRDVVDDDIVVSLGPIQPYNDVFLVSASNIIENYIIKKSNDVTTFPSRFIRPHNKLWGLSSKSIMFLKETFNGRNAWFGILSSIYNLTAN